MRIHQITAICLPLLLWLALFGALPARGRAGEVAPGRLLLLRGAIALGEERCADAVTDLREATLLFPEDWSVQFLYSRALATVGETALARSHFRRSGLLDPSDPVHWLRLAALARDLKDPNLELWALSGYLRLFPDDPIQLQRLVLVYRAVGRPADAEKADARWRALLPALKLDYRFLVGFRTATLGELRTLHADEPDNRAILYALATEAFRAGELSETRESLHSLYEIDPRNPEVAAGYAHLCLVQGEVEEALRVLRDAAPRGNAAMNRALACWSVAAGRPTDAVEPLQRLLDRDSVDPVCNRLLGLVMRLQGNAQAANVAYRIAWLREHDALTAQQYAVTLQAEGQAEEAERILRQALTLSPTETMLSLQLARCRAEAGRLAQSADALADVAASRPEAVEILLLAGERYLQAGYVQRAYAMASTLRDDFPTNPTAVLGAVQLFRRLDARSEARLTLTRYLGPGFPPPLPKPQILLLIAREAAADNRLKDALQALDDLLDHYPDTREGYRLLGNLHVQQANWQAAIRCYRAALARWPTDGEFLLALARATAQGGNIPQAMLLYSQAADRLPTAEPWLELGTLHARQGDEAHARTFWEAAATRPDGAFRARLLLLASYERDRDPTAATLAAELTTRLADERAARATRWQVLLKEANLTATREEIDALLLLAPDLTDPASLTARAPAGRERMTP